MRYIDKKKQAVKLLAEAGVPDADIDAEYLLEEAAGMNRSRLFTELFSEVPPAVEERLDSFIERRRQHEPLQYIVGYQDFMGYRFKCNPDVLIPRQDTEILVENALLRLKQMSSKKNGRLRYLDLCTGSGCIPISLVKLTDGIDCLATDISEKALAVAEENAKANEAAVTFLKSDLWGNIEGRFDLITSNPPYIETEVISGLMPEVSDYEPGLALDGGADGLVFYREIIGKATEHMECDGWLLMEIGDTQGEAVSGLMKAAGLTDVRVIKDLAGLDRVVEGRRI